MSGIRSRQSCLLVAAACAATCSSVISSPAFAQRSHELTIYISSVRAIDRTDTFGRADFYARVTIDGVPATTPVIRQTDSVRPNWSVSRRVARGRHDVKIELLDRDPGKPDDVIDINRVSSKRDLDFQVDTATCRITGFASTYRCNQTITREGGERKRAEVQFSVRRR